MKLFIRLSAFLLLIATASCNKDAISDLDQDWLFPIAKGELSMNSLEQLRNLEYSVQVQAPNIGQPVNTPVSSPGLQIDHVGPFPVQITNWLRRVDIDTIRFTGSLNNFFPIPIGAGTMVTLRNSRDLTDASIVGSALIDHDIAPGANFSFDMQMYHKTLGDSAYFTLDQFNSPAFENVVFTAAPVQLKIDLDVVKASYAQIYTGKTFSTVDTSSFSIGDDGSGTENPGNQISDTSVRGLINVFTDNGLPAGISAQLYFLDETQTQILDSLFVPGLNIAGGQTDAGGNTISVKSDKTRIAVEEQKLKHIRQAKHVVSRFVFSTEGNSDPYVSINKSAKLSIQFTGDLNIRFNF